MRDGSFVHDFLLRSTPRTLHVVNAPSPAATSAFRSARRWPARSQSAWAAPRDAGRISGRGRRCARCGGAGRRHVQGRLRWTPPVGGRRAHPPRHPMAGARRRLPRSRRHDRPRGGRRVGLRRRARRWRDDRPMWRPGARARLGALGKVHQRLHPLPHVLLRRRGLAVGRRRGHRRRLPPRPLPPVRRGVDAPRPGPLRRLDVAPGVPGLLPRRRDARARRGLRHPALRHDGEPVLHRHRDGGGDRLDGTAVGAHRQGLRLAADGHRGRRLDRGDRLAALGRVPACDPRGPRPAQDGTRDRRTVAAGAPGTRRSSSRCWSCLSSSSTG